MTRRPSTDAARVEGARVLDEDLDQLRVDTLSRATSMHARLARRRSCGPSVEPMRAAWRQALRSTFFTICAWPSSISPSTNSRNTGSTNAVSTTVVPRRERFRRGCDVQ